MKIVIPTYMREAEQNCFNKLPEFLQKNTILFTHSGRAPLLRGHLPGAHVYNMGKCDGIADVRQNVIEHCELMGLDKIFMCDDQCYFNYRDTDNRLRVMDCDARWMEMVALMGELLDEYPQVGISPRPGNNRVLDQHRPVSRAYSCYGLNLKMLRQHGVRFDGMYRKDPKVKLYEDFYLTLSLLTRGIPNTVIYDFATYHTHGKTGGNSTFRNNDTQKYCIEALAAEFPGVVKLVQKGTKTWRVEESGSFRWDCTIQWRRAYQQGLEASLL